MREQLRMRGLSAIEQPSCRGGPIVLALSYFRVSQSGLWFAPIRLEQFSLLRVESVNHIGEDDGQPE